MGKMLRQQEEICYFNWTKMVVSKKELDKDLSKDTLLNLYKCWPKSVLAAFKYKKGIWKLFEPF